MGTWTRIHCFTGYSKGSLQEAQEGGVKGTVQTSVKFFFCAVVWSNYEGLVASVRIAFKLKHQNTRISTQYLKRCLALSAAYFYVNCSSTNYNRVILTLTDVQAGGCRNGDMDQ